MKIIIAGAGDVGSHLAKLLSSESHDIYLIDENEERLQRVITISLDSENTQMPFGSVKTGPFLELFWRKTGADCDGEEEWMNLPDGNTYLICLATQCE